MTGGRAAGGPGAGAPASGGPPAGISIRLLRSDDAIPELTALLRRAYAPLAARGLRYTATWQDDATTRRRCERGECLVALDGARIVGTIVWYRTAPESGAEWYRRPDVAHFGQFGVEPDRKSGGIGRALLDEVERRAAAAGFAEIACDTAAPADELIAMYTRRGFRLVGRVQWGPTNYESVVLSKPLGPPAPESPGAG